jgi:hypothetical protein
MLKKKKLRIFSVFLLTSFFVLAIHNKKSKVLAIELLDFSLNSLQKFHKFKEHNTLDINKKINFNNFSYVGNKLKANKSLSITNNINLKKLLDLQYRTIDQSELTYFYKTGLTFNNKSAIFFQNKRLYQPIKINALTTVVYAYKPLLKPKHILLNNYLNIYKPTDFNKFKEFIVYFTLKYNKFKDVNMYYFQKSFGLNTIMFYNDFSSNLQLFTQKTLEKVEKQYKIFNFTQRKVSKEFGFPLKTKLRDTCVETVTHVFKIRKWTKQNLHNPVTQFVRTTTGTIIFDDPQAKTAIKKHGFKNLTENSNILKINTNRIESSLSRLKIYNRVYCSDFTDFSISQLLSKTNSDKKIILPNKFYKHNVRFLAQRYILNDFNEETNNSNKGLVYNDVKIINSSFNDLENLIPKYLVYKLRTFGYTFENLIFRKVLRYDKILVQQRNFIVKKSLRYFPLYHKIETKLIDDAKIQALALKEFMLPLFYLGPLLNKQSFKKLNDFGYSLGYIKIKNKKFYINPSNGLISYYVNNQNKLFNGDDLTTFYGMYKGKGYYIDKHNVKYFSRDLYRRKYDFTFYLTEVISPDDFPKARNNLFFFRREFYYDKAYVNLKNLSGDWQDTRSKYRTKGNCWYSVKKK